MEYTNEIDEQAAPFGVDAIKHNLEELGSRLRGAGMEPDCARQDWEGLANVLDEVEQFAGALLECTEAFLGDKDVSDSDMREAIRNTVTDLVGDAVGLLHTAGRKAAAGELLARTAAVGEGVPAGELLVTGISLVSEGLLLDVRPSKRAPRCGECGRRRPECGSARTRLWRHLDLGGMKTMLRYAMRHVQCSTCGVRVERVPWARCGSRFTLPFENQVAYLAQRCDKTTVSQQMRITWRAVGKIVMRVIDAVGMLSGSTGSNTLESMS